MAELFWSIVVPGSADARVAAMSLDSIIAQDDVSWEAIVIVPDEWARDYGSLVERLSGDRRIRWVDAGPTATAAACNAGFLQARGRWLRWLRLGACFEPGQLAADRRHIESRAGRRVFFGDPSGEMARRRSVVSSRLYESEAPEIGILDLVGLRQTLPSSLVFDRRCIAEVGLFRGSLLAAFEYEYILRLVRVWRAGLLPPSGRRMDAVELGTAASPMRSESTEAVLALLNKARLSDLLGPLARNGLSDGVSIVQGALDLAADEESLLYALGAHPLLILRVLEWINGSNLDPSIVTIQRCAVVDRVRSEAVKSARSPLRAMWQDLAAAMSQPTTLWPVTSIEPRDLSDQTERSGSASLSGEQRLASAGQGAASAIDAPSRVAVLLPPDANAQRRDHWMATVRRKHPASQLVIVDPLSDSFEWQPAQVRLPGRLMSARDLAWIAHCDRAYAKGDDAAWLDTRKISDLEGPDVANGSTRAEPADAGSGSTLVILQPDEALAVELLADLGAYHLGFARKLVVRWRGVQAKIANSSGFETIWLDAVEDRAPAPAPSVLLDQIARELIRLEREIGSAIFVAAGRDAVEAAALAGVTYLACLHAGDAARPDRDISDLDAFRQGLRQALAIVVLSADHACRLKDEAGLPASSFHVIPSSEELGRIRRRSLTMPRDDLLQKDVCCFLFPARPASRSDGELVVDASDLLRRQGRSFALLAVDVGPMATTLRGLAGAGSLAGTLTLYGENEDIAPVMRRSDALIVTPSCDPWFALEAGMLGTPIIATEGTMPVQGVVSGTDPYPDALAAAMARFMDDRPYWRDRAAAAVASGRDRAYRASAAAWNGVLREQSRSAVLSLEEEAVVARQPSTGLSEASTVDLANELALRLAMGAQDTVRQAFHRHGFRLVQESVYSPILDVASDLWSEPSNLTGLDMNPQAALDLARTTLPEFLQESRTRLADGKEIWREGESCPSDAAYMAVDAHVYYGLIRSYKPKRIIEIGIGYSTLVAIAASAMNEREGRRAQVIGIGPDPGPCFKEGHPGLDQLVPSPVQDVPLPRFEELTSGDMLVFNSIKFSKTSWDLRYAILEVLPRLRSGVMVQMHDFSLPLPSGSYDRDLKLLRDEQCLLQAFLAFNQKFEILWSSSHMMSRYPELMLTTFPEIGLVRETHPQAKPGAFWMRVREAASLSDRPKAD